MTLKQFLEKNNVSATKNQRSHLGRLIKSNNLNKKIMEDGYLVKNYNEVELIQDENIDIIINFLNSKS